ncbi:GM16923 [Drosophila sechellia]|uniref:GM16923 n=1 Tax=Drosophila sechellia TaxID=7238 RepID=B4IM89_DROSE|nr:GM16923 [Drosophila sechellia]
MFADRPKIILSLWCLSRGSGVRVEADQTSNGKGLENLLRYDSEDDGPHATSDLTTALQNEDPKFILTMILQELITYAGNCICEGTSGPCEREKPWRRQSRTASKHECKVPPKAKYGLIASGLGGRRNEPEALPTTRSSCRLSEENAHRRPKRRDSWASPLSLLFDPWVLAIIVWELFLMQTTLWPTEVAPAPDFPCVTELEVVEAAKRINPNKAPGLDGIPGVVIKAVPSSTLFWTESFQQGGKARN